MPTVQIGARFNESKQQMQVDVELTNGVPTQDLTGTRLGLLLKDADDGFNQQQVYGHYVKAIDSARDNNLLDQIAAGDFAGFSHLVVSLERGGAVTTVGVVAGGVYAAVPVDSISIAIPVEAGWAKDSATNELTNISTRLYEKFLEDFLKGI